METCLCHNSRFCSTLLRSTKSRIGEFQELVNISYITKIDLEGIEKLWSTLDLEGSVVLIHTLM